MRFMAAAVEKNDRIIGLRLGAPESDGKATYWFLERSYVDHGSSPSRNEALMEWIGERWVRGKEANTFKAFANC
jgi:hypothetical protein